MWNTNEDKSQKMGYLMIHLLIIISCHEDNGKKIGYFKINLLK